MELTLHLKELIGISFLPFILCLFFIMVYFRRRIKGMVYEQQKMQETLCHSIQEEEELKENLSQFKQEYEDLSNLFVVLPDLARELSSSLSLAQIGPVIIRIIKRIVAVDEVCFFLIDRAKRKLVLKSAYGLPKDMDKIELEIDANSMVGLAIKNKMIMIREDLEKTDLGLLKPIKLNDKVNISPLYAAPLVLKNEVLGVLTLNKILMDNKHLKKYLAIISNLGAVALKNALLLLDMQFAADKDGLTKLYNHRYFQEKLVEEKMRADREQTLLSLFMFDIDHFKHYNDTNGHQAGDDILSGVASLIQNNVRAIDTACRYGGEEFTVILPATEKKKAFEFAKRLREIINQHKFPHGEKQPLGSISISGGVSTYPLDATSGKDLINAADSALYKAKEGGRNQVFLFEAFDYSKEDNS